MFVISYGVVIDKPFQPSLMFVLGNSLSDRSTSKMLHYKVKHSAYPQILDYDRKVCYWQTLKLITKIRDKKFYNIGPWSQCYKIFCL